MIHAVIFDMDGVLIDSEIVYLDHMFKRLKLHYPQVTLESLYPVVGATSQRTMAVVADAVGEDTGSEAFQKIYASLWEGCHANYPSILRKEVPDLLRELHHRGYAVALASSTSSPGIEEVLTTCGLKDDFDYVVSGDEFKESKPNPEIYLHTASVLGCPPESCLVVEDSTYGITAGHRAGMTVAALIDDRFGFDRTLADFSMVSLKEVIPVLEKLEEAHD